MVTIKEVAAAAGVSLGTASNVINGKTNNKDLIERVEEAIRLLDYRPDAKARSLKSAHTFLIGIVVDSLNDYSTQQLLSSLERQFRSRGYSIVLRTSGNNAILESKNIEYFIQLGVDGIIISTSQKKKSWLKKIKGKNIPIVYITRSTHIDLMSDRIYISHRPALEKFFHWCKSKQYKKTGFILEMASFSIKELEQVAREHHADILYKIVGDNSGESGFKAAYELLYENPDIDNLVIGGTMLAKGVHKVLQIKGIWNNIALVCVAPESWIDNDGIYDGIIEISDYDIGCIASNRLLEKIDNTDLVDNKLLKVYSDFKEKKASLKDQLLIGKQGASINLALLETETSNVLKMLSEVYEKTTGVHINYYFYKYFDLWNLITNEEELKNKNIDIVMFDILWKDNLMEHNMLKDISFLFQKQPEYFEDYINNITDNFCIHNDKLYGLPFMTGTQLLIYQKDLFEDNSFKIQFRRQFGKELRVPQTWEEFNQIAEFFTKEYNDKSPVSYGTALINEGNLYNSIDFLNRLWTYEDINSDGKGWHLNSENIKVALKNYKNAFCFSDINARFNTWEDVANAFKKGDVAMVVLYDSFAFGINDAMFSKVAGNVGSAMIPGRCPVLGGWGLGLTNTKDKVDKTVLDYLMWSCGDIIAEPFSILSGTSSRKSFYANKESTGLYPWKDQILESYSRSRRRQSIKTDGNYMNNLKLYDEIVGNALGKYIRDEITSEEIIKELEVFRLHSE